MAAGVAHEINNPLASIGELSGLLEDLIDDRFLQSSEHGPLFRDNVRKIQEHVERARTVTHRLLGFARRMEPRHDTIQVNEVVEEALSFIEREAGFQNVRIERRLDPSIPAFETDRAQLQQVLLNLFNNALDASEEGGRIIVHSSSTADAIEVAVEDDGEGISKEIADSIFDPFFTTKAPGQGNGLGLSISHSIMQNLGGSLSFESEPGRGSIFRVRLPRAAA
jgi:two-component system NtrC family sensor kinase